MNFDKPQNLENNLLQRNILPNKEEVVEIINMKENDIELNDLKNLELKNEKDLKKYAEVIPKPSYPSVSESFDKLTDLTNIYFDEEYYSKNEAIKYFLDYPIHDNFTIEKIKFELQNYPGLSERICNYWDVMDNDKYSFIQKQTFEAYFQETFLKDDYKIENHNFDFNTHESIGLDHASFFNKSLCIEALNSNDKQVEKVLGDLMNKSENFKNNPYNYPYLVDYFIQTDKTFKERLIADLKNCFDNYDFSKLPQWHLIGQSKEISLVYKELLTTFLNHYELRDNQTFLNSWIEADYEHDGGCVKKNIENIVLLEKQKPGSSKILYEKNGVTRFDRMSPEFWSKQTEIEDTPGKFGMFIVSRHDHNNAFESSEVGEKLEKVYASLKDNGYITRYIEVANKIDLAKKLLKQDIILGDQDKIEYAIVFAHGSPDGISLTQNFDEKSLKEISSADFKRSNDIKYIDKSDFEGEGFKKAKKFFVDEPQVGFISCSVGALDGFAQSFSTTYNSNSVAADKPIRLKDISVIFNNNKPRFDIEYSVSEDAYKNSFSGGKITKQDRIISEV
jgi:uncharacterized protein (UPF0297 family)